MLWRRPRSRVPLHRRLRQDPAAIRHWAVVALLAWLLASLVGHALDQADSARARWGRTTVVWVADGSVRSGERLDESVRAERWPIALVPDAAVETVPDGARAAGPIDPGSAVTRALIEPAGPDRRQVAVPLGEARLPVREGDRVDVWATADPAAVADGSSGTRRVAVDARVIASTDRSVVLEVAPDQVEAVTEAAATATVALVGR